MRSNPDHLLHAVRATQELDIDSLIVKSSEKEDSNNTLPFKVDEKIVRDVFNNFHDSEFESETLAKAYE